MHISVLTMLLLLEVFHFVVFLASALLRLLQQPVYPSVLEPVDWIFQESNHLRRGCLEL